MIQILRIQLFVVLLFLSISTFSQFEILRHANSIYYEIDRLESSKPFIQGLDSSYTNRYVVLQFKNNTAELKLADQQITFQQKGFKSAKHRRMVLMIWRWKRELVSSENDRIRSVLDELRLVKIDDQQLTLAGEYAHYNERGKKIREDITFGVDRSQLEGMYIGSGKNYRTIFGGLIIGVFIVEFISSQ